nr:ubx domain-containing protein 6 [Quercus suber]
MFHSGDLTSGISLAIQQQKFVACFVREEDNEESQTWEDGWLQEEIDDGRPFGEALGDRAVLLRLTYGSQEAAFLGAFCPIERAPTLVIIHNGQVLEKLESGTSRNDFQLRLKNAVGLQKEDDPKQDVTAATSTTPNAVTNVQADNSLQDLMAERGERLEAQRAEREAAEKAKRVARANARRKEAEEAAAAHGHEPGAGKGKQRATTELTDKEKSRRDWIYQQKQRKDEAKRDRQRILDRIEADKLERKLKTQRAREPDEAASFMESWQVPAPSSSLSNKSSTCTLQVRLFDGSSIRSRFLPTATLANEIRDWIKDTSPDNAENKAPFTFRQVLAPSPSRSIGESDEHKTVQELGLTPSATLVLVPVTGFVDAYSDGNSGGLLGLLYSSTSGLWNSLGSLGSFLPSFTIDHSTPLPNDNTPSTRDQSASAAGPATIRVRTLASQRDEADTKNETEFYNGNSLGFEGKRGDNADDTGKKS